MFRKICFLCMILSAAKAYEEISLSYDIETPIDEQDPSEKEEEGCPNLSYLPEVGGKSMLGQWHLPLMSRNWVYSMAKGAHSKFTKRLSTGQFCVKLTVTPLLEKDMSYPNATISIRSKCPRSGEETKLLCAPLIPTLGKWYCKDTAMSSKQEDSMVYIVDTDNHSYALIIRCFPNSGIDWAIFSKERKLDRSLIKTLLGKVEMLGFKLFNVIEIPYEKCL